MQAQARVESPVEVLAACLRIFAERGRALREARQAADAAQAGELEATAASDDVAKAYAAKG